MASKKIFSKVITLITAFALTVSSCNKNEIVTESSNIISPEKSKTSNNSKWENSRNSTQTYAAVQFSSVRSIMDYYAPLLVTTIPIDGNPQSLSNTIIPPDITNQNVLRQMFADVKSFISQHYPQLGSTDAIDVNDPECAIFVITFAALEENGFANTIGSKNELNRFSSWLRCTIDIVAGYFDIVALIRGLATFETASVWAVVKFGIKKYCGWMIAACLIYDIVNNCV